MSATEQSAPGHTILDKPREFLFEDEPSEPDGIDTFSWGSTFRITKVVGRATPKYSDLQKLRIALFLEIAEEIGLREGDILTESRKVGVRYKVLSVTHNRGDEALMVKTEEPGEGYLLQIPKE